METVIENPGLKKPLPEMPQFLKESKENTLDDLKTLGWYNKELASKLPKHIFENNPARIKWFVAFFAISILGWTGIIATDLPWIAKGFLAFAVGVCHTGMAFASHEVLHGSVIKNKKIQTFIGFFGFGPFLISPTFWKYWHNRLHHGKTQLNIIDPDAFPTLGVYKRVPYIQKIFPWTPGSGYLRSYLYFFFWFSKEAFVNQLYKRFSDKRYKSCDHAKVTKEFYAQIIICLGVLIAAGLENLPWVIMIFAVQNYGVMSYISTNHNLQPLTKKNDPLVNSLTVTNKKFWEMVHLDFGYHVEHHIFPSVTHDNNRKYIHEELKKAFPEKFKVMPKSQALKLLYSTPRIYNSATELIHPETMETFKTI